MATTADIRNGLVMHYNNDLYAVVDFQHVKPGKGPAFVRTKLKSVRTGKVIDNTFPSGHKIETAMVLRRKYQYLYNDDLGFHFMNTETFEQIVMQEGLINAPKFLQEGAVCEVMFHEETETPLTCEIPEFLEMEVTYTEPGIKGDTATNTLKPATLDTGAEIMVPLFIDIGEKIKVDTRDGKGSYVERVKN